MLYTQLPHRYPAICICTRFTWAREVATLPKSKHRPSDNSKVFFLIGLSPDRKANIQSQANQRRMVKSTQMASGDLCVRNFSRAKAQRRKGEEEQAQGAKKTLRNAVALCAFASLREISSLKKRYSLGTAGSYGAIGKVVTPLVTPRRVTVNHKLPVGSPSGSLTI